MKEDRPSRAMSQEFDASIRVKTIS